MLLNIKNNKAYPERQVQLTFCVNFVKHATFYV